MIEGRRALDATGLRRRHLLVITDGENTDGVSPVDVARVMERQDGSVRAPVYFVAFDVDATVFAGVKQHGGLLLSAKDGARARGHARRAAERSHSRRSAAQRREAE